MKSNIIPKKHYKFEYTNEALDHLYKRLRIKPLKESYNLHNIRIKIRRFSTLKRIEEYYTNNKIFSIYPNAVNKIEETSGHFFLDIWINQTLVTFTVNKKNK